MKPGRLFVKYLVRGVYFPLYFFLLMIPAVGISWLLGFLSMTPELKDLFKMCSAVFSMLLFGYSLWLAREASLSFSEENSFFLEAYFAAFKRSFLYLPFIPGIGRFFDREPSRQPGNESVKTLEGRTRFD